MGRYDAALSRFNATDPLPASDRLTSATRKIHDTCGGRSPFYLPDLPQRLAAETFLMARLIATRRREKEPCVARDPARASAVLLMPHIVGTRNVNPAERRKFLRGEASCYDGWQRYLQRMWQLLAERAPQLRSKHIFMHAPDYLSAACAAGTACRDAVAARNFTPIAKWIGDWPGGLSIGHSWRRKTNLRFPLVCSTRH